MKRITKFLLALALAVITASASAMPASAVYASECGLKVVKNKSYNEDGKFYMSFAITGGKPAGCAIGETYASVKVLNSSGKSVLTWKESKISSGSTVTKNYGYDWDNNLPRGTYTFQLVLRVEGWSDTMYYNGSTSSYGTKYNYSFNYNYTITHTQPAVVSLKSVENIMRDDGSYANKFVFSHSGAKGQVLNMEIYDQWGTKVYSARGSSPISYTSGTYSFQWGGYPSGGGVQCDSGEYTVKYWLDGKNAKQAKHYLSIY
jgi:flagellar hook assembly protein FlgD